MDKEKPPDSKKKPGPKKSEKTIARERKEFWNWTKKEAKARELYIETPYEMPLREIAAAVATSTDIVKQWKLNGGWDLLRVHRQQRLTEKYLKEHGLSLEQVHFHCLELYRRAIDSASKYVLRESKQYVPDFETMGKAIEMGAKAEFFVRELHKWMPTVEQKAAIDELIAEGNKRVKEICKEFQKVNATEPVEYRGANLSDDESVD